MAIIVIDAGHCDKWIGARHKQHKEEQDTLELALLVEKYLVSFGHTVHLTRRNGEPLNKWNSNSDLKARPLFANKMKADYFISLHRNSFYAPNASGIEGWIYSKSSPKTIKIADSVLNECLKVAKVTNRGIKKGYTGNPNVDYCVNRVSTMPSMLLELLFISNDNDNEIFQSHKDDYAKAIAVGICKGLGVNHEAPKEEPKPEKIYRVQVGAYSFKIYALLMKNRLQKLGYKPFVTYDGKWNRVQVGAFTVKENAEKYKNEIIKKGFSAFIV